MIYQPKRVPWVRQQEALDKMEGRRAFALLMAMRTGKTKVAIDDFGRMELAGEAKDLLIIAPASVYETWMEALQDHGSADLLARLYSHLWRAGETSKAALKREKAFLSDTTSPRALLVNVEALSTVERARSICLEFLSQRPGLRVAAVDESTTIKNYDSSRGEFVNDEIAPRTDWRRILCGLPTPRSPLDLFGQFNFLDREILGYDNFKSFEARYTDIEQVCMLPNEVLISRLERFGKSKFLLEGIGLVEPRDLPRQMIIGELQKRRSYIQTIPQIRGYRHEEELASKIAPYSYRCRLKDCYDVPDKLYSFREVEMTAEQRRVYKELKEIATAQLDSMHHVTATHVITRILRLHQVLCGHVRDDDDGLIREVKENRTAALMELLEEYDGKAVIWCSYDYNVEGISAALRKRYGDDSVSRFWGGNRRTREEEERAFKSDPKRRWMVATQSAGGRGRLWSVANLMVYFSSTNNLEHRLQSEERGDEVGKMDPVACVDLRVRGTVDEKIIRALREKLDMAARITGDSWREWLI